eukprot:c22550_g1_i2 orf=117-1250(+)
MKGAMEIGGLFDHVKELICQRKAELLSREDGSSHVFGEGKVETQEQGELMGTSPGKEEFESGLEKEFLLESGHEHGSTLEEIDCCNGKDDDETKIMEDNVIMNIHDSEGIESKDAEKAFPKLIRYAREDLLVLQKNSVDSSEKWDRIVGDVGPVIDELWSLDISRPRRRKGDCHQGGSSQTQIPAKKVSSDNKVELAKDMIQEFIRHTTQDLISSTGKIAQNQLDEWQGILQKMIENSKRQISPDYQQGIQNIILEERERQAREVKLRIWGLDSALLDKWKDNSKSNSKETNDQEILQYFHIRYGIQLRGVNNIDSIGQHLIIAFKSKVLRDEALMQAKRLKGSGIWFAEELTKLQLGQRKAELAKVRMAREEGKWA